MLSRLSAAFDAPYAEMLIAVGENSAGGPGHNFELSLDTFTIQPSPASRIAGIAASDRSSGALALASNMMLRRFTEKPSSGFWIDAAALFTRISTCPPRNSAASGITRARSASSTRSATTMPTRVP